jgi:nitrate reductase NapE component
MTYKSVYKNTGTVPRTLDQAYKNAEYATPIYRMRTEWDDAKEFFIGFVVFSIFVAVCLVLGYSFMEWLEITK